MAVEITPTLELMLHIYSLSKEGGAGSERFVTFRTAAADGRPIPGYNPMTRAPVGETIAALIDLDAEAVAREVATETAAAIGLTDEVQMYFTVAAPGLWTDRFGTEVEHRLKATRPESIVMWFDAEVTAESITSAVVEQTVRLHEVNRRAGRPPESLQQAVEQEGRALAQAGASGQHDDDAAKILDEMGADSRLGTMVGFFYGDDGAEMLGYAPLGLPGKTGYHHAVSLYGVKSHP